MERRCSVCGMPCGLGLISSHWGDDFCSHHCLDEYLLNQRRRDEKRKTWILGALIVLGFAAILMMVSNIARADHSTAHFSFQVGKQTETQVRFIACLDVNDAMAVPTTHEKEGYEAAKMYAQFIQMFGICPTMTARITVVEIMWEKKLPFPDGDSTVYIVHLTVEGSDVPIYSPMSKIEIRKADGGT